MKAEDEEDDFPAMGRALARLEAVRSAMYYGSSWNLEGFMEFGRAILDVFQLSWVVEDSIGIPASLARQYLWVVCPELSLPCGLHSGHMLELLDGPAGLKWLEIEERNHPGLFEVEELRNALRNPPEGWDRDGKPQNTTITSK